MKNPIFLLLVIAILVYFATKKASAEPKSDFFFPSPYPEDKAGPVAVKPASALKPSTFNTLLDRAKDSILQQQQPVANTFPGPKYNPLRPNSQVMLDRIKQSLSGGIQ